MDSLAAQPQSMGSMEFYEKGVVIGHGTHGHVYRAIHRSSGQAFAVKKVRPGEDEGVSMTALREIKLLRELKGTSPHVVDLVDAFPHKGKLLLVYELLEGDLDAIIKDNGEQLGPAAVKCVMQQLLKALAHIHAAGIVHRDIKPDNLLMSSVGCLKVGDFGLARTMPPTALQQARWAQRPLCSVNAPRSPFFPTPGLSSNCMQDSFDPSSLVLSPMSALQATISPRCQSDAASSMLTDCCSPGLKYTNQVCARWYRAPELLYSAGHYDSAIDIWSAGCVFAELILGRVWFPGNSDMEQLGLIFKALGPPETVWPEVTQLKNYLQIRATGKPLSNQFPGASEEALDLLARMVALNPAHRISAAKALEHPFFSVEPLPAEPQDLPRPRPKQRPPLQDKSNVLLAAFGPANDHVRESSFDCGVSSHDVEYGAAAEPYQGAGHYTEQVHPWHQEGLETGTTGLLQASGDTEFRDRDQHEEFSFHQNRRHSNISVPSAANPSGFSTLGFSGMALHTRTSMQHAGGYPSVSQYQRGAGFGSAQSHLGAEPMTLGTTSSLKRPRQLFESGGRGMSGLNTGATGASNPYRQRGAPPAPLPLRLPLDSRDATPLGPAAGDGGVNSHAQEGVMSIDALGFPNWPDMDSAGSLRLMADEQLSAGGPGAGAGGYAGAGHGSVARRGRGRRFGSFDASEAGDEEKAPPFPHALLLQGVPEEHGLEDEGSQSADVGADEVDAGSELEEGEEGEEGGQTSQRLRQDGYHVHGAGGHEASESSVSAVPAENKEAGVGGLGGHSASGLHVQVLMRQHQLRQQRQFTDGAQTATHDVEGASIHHPGQEHDSVHDELQAHLRLLPMVQMMPGGFGVGAGGLAPGMDDDFVSDEDDLSEGEEGEEEEEHRYAPRRKLHDAFACDSDVCPTPSAPTHACPGCTPRSAQECLQTA